MCVCVRAWMCACHGKGGGLEHGEAAGKCISSSRVGASLEAGNRALLREQRSRRRGGNLGNGESIAMSWVGEGVYARWDLVLIRNLPPSLLPPRPAAELRDAGAVDCGLEYRF